MAYPAGYGIREFAVMFGPHKNRSWRHAAFTLIELLVVIAITGLLSGLVLSAVQKAREAANRTTCINNLHQIGLAMLHHESVDRRFPTGGWGWSWVGDPDRGTDQRQPGGWIYNILPFIEQAPLYHVGAGLPWDKKLEASTGRLALPLPFFNCPSRRTGGPYPNGMNTAYYNAKNPVLQLARSDYAANSGDEPINQIGAGPASLREGDDPKYKGWHAASDFTGIVFERSRITFGDITNGTSNTYLVGEKYLCPKDYNTGLDPSDNENMYVGFDNDVNRVTTSPPLQDRKDVSNDFIFGSAHTGGANMLNCDGSVHVVSYSVDAPVHRRAGNRR